PLRAPCGSPPALLPCAPSARPADQVLPGQEIIQIRVSHQGLRRLAGFFQDAYARDPAGGIIVLGGGQYASSRFYAAREKYSLLRTCNTWTARALREAGLPIEPLQVVTAAGLMDELPKLVHPEPPSPPS